MSSEHPLLRSPFPTSVFVTGTGTDVGKTLCSAFLCALWEADYWKPVQTGAVHDSLEILRLSPCTPVHFSTIQLDEPASPHWAAQLEDVRIDLHTLVDSQPDGYWTVVEGAGGALVPLNESEDMIDLARALGLPMVIVASTGLGTIHHTLSTVQCIRSRGVEIVGVLFNGLPHGENARQIRDRGKVSILGRIPPMFPVDAQAVQALVARWKSGDWTDPCEEETPIQAVRAGGPSLSSRDKAVIWHPFTQHKTSQEPLEIVQAHGAILRTQDHSEVIDAISSWWVCNHGHARPEIAQAIATQARTLEQVIFAGCTHEPAVQLAETLLPLLPGQMSKLFFSDDGSTSVEVAIKACVQMARHRGVARPRVVALEDAYHGDTIGAMSAGARSVFSTPFDPYLFEVDRLPTPAGPWAPDSPTALANCADAIQAMARWLELHHRETACIIVEPLVQGSAGMRMYPRAYLEELDALCAQFQVPWIADEVFTGFGRTGSYFACTAGPGQTPLHPSAICLSKGLTGGFMPLGVTAFSEPVFQDFLSEDRSRTFFHGHSFTGNPLGCAAALASLELLQQPTTRSDWERLETGHRGHMEALAKTVAIQGPRILGTIAAFELPGTQDLGYLASRGQEIVRRCRDRGVLLRPLGDTIYVMPPWSIRDHELARVYDCLEDVLE